MLKELLSYGSNISMLPASTLSAGIAAVMSRKEPSSCTSARTVILLPATVLWTIQIACSMFAGGIFIGLMFLGPTVWGAPARQRLRAAALLCVYFDKALKNLVISASISLRLIPKWASLWCLGQRAITFSGVSLPSSARAMT